MAGRVRAASGALIGMHPAEIATLTQVGGSWRQRLARWLRSRGAPSNQLAEILALMAEAGERHASLARPDMDIEHGSRPLGTRTGVTAIWTPGHTHGQLCFYDEQQNVLLTGDHVLTRITPHIGLPPGAAGDPLADYLTSPRALVAYRRAQVLPAHEYRFAYFSARLDALLLHHLVRLAEIEHTIACYPGFSAWAVTETLAWSRGWDRTRGSARLAAVSETWAHLVHPAGTLPGADHGAGVDAWQPGPRCSAAD